MARSCRRPASQDHTGPTENSEAPFFLGEDPRGSLSPGQFGQGDAERASQLLLVEALRRLVLRRGWHRGQQLVVNRDRAVSSAAGAHLVGGDPVHPRAQAGLGPELRQVLPCLGQGVLHGVLSVVGVAAEHCGGVAEHPRPVPVDDVREGATVTQGRATGQDRVVGQGRILGPGLNLGPGLIGGR